MDAEESEPSLKTLNRGKAPRAGIQTASATVTLSSGAILGSKTLFKNGQSQTVGSFDTLFSNEKTDERGIESITISAAIDPGANTALLDLLDRQLREKYPKRTFKSNLEEAKAGEIYRMSWTYTYPSDATLRSEEAAIPSTIRESQRSLMSTCRNLGIAGVSTAPSL